jgi:hypothetical protein
MKLPTFKTKYRVVRDDYRGYEAQFKPWYLPFWLQCFGTNTSSTLEGAIRVIDKHKTRVVYIET